MFLLVWQGMRDAGVGVIQGIRVKFKLDRQGLGFYQYIGKPLEDFKQRHDNDF